MPSAKMLTATIANYVHLCSFQPILTCSCLFSPCEYIQTDIIWTHLKGKLVFMTGVPVLIWYVHRSLLGGNKGEVVERFHLLGRQSGYPLCHHACLSHPVNAKLVSFLLLTNLLFYPFRILTTVLQFCKLQNGNEIVRTQGRKFLHQKQHQKIAQVKKKMFVCW